MHWLTQASGWLIVGVAGSLVLSIGGLWAARWFVVSLPKDYFVNPGKPPAFAGQHPLARWSWFLVKNAIGLTLICAGIAMLALPGPGLLTILAGLCLVSIPGKRALTLRLLSNRQVVAAMNALRTRAGVAPLETPGPGGAESHES
jgi:hypothetical protein